MGTPDPVTLTWLIDDAKCFALVRQHRWPDGVRCPGCGGDLIVAARLQRHAAAPATLPVQGSAGRFDDLTGTVLAGHHQPLRVWVLCLYFMGLNLSNRQIALELGLSGSDGQLMTEQLRHGLAARIRRRRWKVRWRSTRCTSWPGTRVNRPRWQKRGALGGAVDWQERRAAARWRRTSHRS